MCNSLHSYLRIIYLIIQFTCIQSVIQAQEPVKSREEQADPDTLQYYFLLRGADVQGNLNYALMNAAAEDDTLGIRWLISHGAEVDATTYDKVTPLMYAVAKNNKESVKILLEKGASPNVLSVYSETPLIVAARNQNIEIAELLIRYSADITGSDRYGAAPLHYASAYGNFYLTDMLLYYEAPTYSKDLEGTTPLMAAAWAGHADVADLLIQNGANPEERDNEGFTPLLIAAQNGDTIMMEILLKRYVDMYETNSYGYHALNLAIKSGHTEAVEYLLRKGDKWNSAGREVVNPHAVASVYKRNNMFELLRKENIPQEIRNGIDQVSVALAIKHCYWDYQAGLAVNAKDPVRNLGVVAGIDFKPSYTRVTIRESEDIFFQYRDKGAIAYAGVFKEFPLTDNVLKGNWSFTTTLAAGYSFGNKLVGTGISPGNKFRFLPSAGFRWNREHIGIVVNLEYMKTDFYRIGPAWMRLGFFYNFFLNDVRSPGKFIKWY